MKKIYVLAGIIFIFSTVMFISTGIIIGSQKDQVTITENIISGDRAAAENISFDISAEYNRNLFWNTSYKIGENPVRNTDYEFYLNKKYDSYFRRYSGMFLSNDIYNSDNFDSGYGIDKAYAELAAETEPGSQNKKNIILNDYYTYYPLMLAIDLPGIIWQGNNYSDLNYTDYGDEKKVWDKFIEFFKIPLPEEDIEVEISIEKDNEGRIRGSGLSYTGNNHYGLYAPSTYTENQCFFSICNRISDNKFIDTSLIPGGYGIYSFSYENVRNESNTDGRTTYYIPGYKTGVNADSLKMVFPLNQTEEVNYISISPDEKKLLLFINDNSEIYLKTIEIDSMKELQKIYINKSPVYEIQEYDDFTVLFFSDSITVISIQENGDYKTEFTVKLPDNADDYINRGFVSMDFDGEKLAVISPLYESKFRMLPTCSLIMSVFDKTGLIYLSEYNNSLSAASNPSEYEYNCHPLEISLKFND